MRQAAGWFDAPRGIAAQWFGVLAGPLAWLLDLQASYSIVQWVCGGGPTLVLHLITLGSLAIIGGGACASWLALQRAAGPESEDGSRPDERGRFLATLGLVSCALFAVVVIAGAIPRVVLDACHQ